MERLNILKFKWRGTECFRNGKNRLDFSIRWATIKHFYASVFHEHYPFVIEPYTSTDGMHQPSRHQKAPATT
jgi:hypothetical protein